MKNDVNVVRDLVQARVLGAIFSNSMKDQIALKGGFAMRVLLGSSRYTKDIDLAASNELPMSVIQGFIRKSLDNVRQTGMIKDISISEPKQTETTMRWKIGGNVNGQELHFTIEISRRDKIEAEAIQKVTYRCSPGHRGAVPIACINLSKMSEAKFDCLKNPTREAPRDIYDLYMLIKMDVRPSLEALKEYGEATLREMKLSIWSKLEKMDYANISQQLLPFLPAGAAKAITPDVWDEIRLVVGDKINAWILETEAGIDELEDEIENDRVAQISL